MKIPMLPVSSPAKKAAVPALFKAGDDRKELKRSLVSTIFVKVKLAACASPVARRLKEKPINAAEMLKCSFIAISLLK